jgi:hypothetical protein
MFQAVEHNKGGVILPWAEHLRGDGGDFRRRDVQVYLLQERKDGLCPARGKRKRSLNEKAGMKFFEKLKEKQNRGSVTGKGMPGPKQNFRGKKRNPSKTSGQWSKTRQNLQSKADKYP